MKKTLGIVIALTLFAGSGLSYGPRGHGLVGAIADRRVTKNTSVKAKVNQLLDGLTLQRVATLPDEIKTWDRNPNGFHLTGHQGLEDQLRAFVAANPNPKPGQSNPPGVPSHHEFHFTDVPVFGNANDLTIAKGLARKEPTNWKLSGAVDTWAEQLANEIIPIAREAHTRLEFTNIKIAPGSISGKDDIKSGRVSEKKQSGGMFY